MDCDVVVIGAGVAGLAATTELARAGMDVHCLEATDVGELADGVFGQMSKSVRRSDTSFEDYLRRSRQRA